MILREHIIEYKYGEQINIAFMGCIHWEVANCDTSHFEKDLRTIIKNNYYLILMGDQLDCLLPDDKRYDHSILRPEYRGLTPDKLLSRSVWDLASYFVPIVKKKKLLGVHWGNHESTLLRVHKRDMVYELCNAIDPEHTDGKNSIHPLDIGYRCAHRIRFVRMDKDDEIQRSSILTLHTWHGGGCPLAPESRLRALRKKADEFPVDLTVIGHWHTRYFEEDCTKITIEKRGELKLQARRRYLGMCGTYYKSMKEGIDSYADKRGYPPTDIGCLMVSINPETLRIRQND